LRFRFKVAPRAAVQIHAAAEWWAKNRTKNPTGFVEDLESAFMLIQDLPNAGEAVPHRTIPNLRRVLLGLTQHHLYYSVAAEEAVIEILALWHTSRGSAPRF
jgi:plasmid stabilization system protein ParE